MFCFWGAAGFAGGLVVAGGVDGELAEEFAGGCVDDPDVEVVDEEDHGGSGVGSPDADVVEPRSEEHTSELQSLMRISYAVFCLKTKNKHNRLSNNSGNQSL